MNSITTPSTSGKCGSLTTKPMMLKFGENLLHLLNKNFFKFDTNPTIEKIFEIKLQRLCHGNPSMLNSCTHLSMNNTFPHIRTNIFFVSHIPSLPFSFPQPKRLPSPLVSLHDLSLSLSPLPNGSFEILPFNQWPSHPSKANEN